MIPVPPCPFAFPSAGDVGKIVLPEGMQAVNFEYCGGLTGTLVAMPPPSIKDFNIKKTGVKIDVTVIELPANTTALVHTGGALVCRAPKTAVKCNENQLIGDIGKLVLSESIQTVNFARCTGLTGTTEL